MSEDKPTYSEIIIEGLEDLKISLKRRGYLQEFTATVDNIGKMIKENGDNMIESRGNVFGDNHLEYVKSEGISY